MRLGIVEQSRVPGHNPLTISNYVLDPTGVIKCTLLDFISSFSGALSNSVFTSFLLISKQGSWLRCAESYSMPDITDSLAVNGSVLPLSRSFGQLQTPPWGFGHATFTLVVMMPAVTHELVGSRYLFTSLSV